MLLQAEAAQPKGRKEGSVTALLEKSRQQVCTPLFYGHTSIEEPLLVTACASSLLRAHEHWRDASSRMPIAYYYNPLNLSIFSHR